MNEVCTNGFSSKEAYSAVSRQYQHWPEGSKKCINGSYNKISTYKIYGNTIEEVSFCEQCESYDMSSTIDDTDRRGSKSSKVSFCE